MIKKLINQYNKLDGKETSRKDLTDFYLSLFDYLPESEIIRSIRTKIEKLLESNDADLFRINLQDQYLEYSENDLIGLGVPFIADDSHLEAGLKKAVSPNDIYNMITEKVIDMMENDKGLVWHKPWTATGNFGESATNLKTKTVYRGINDFLLNVVAPHQNGGSFKSPFFLSFKQMQDLGGTLKEGSKGHIVIYFSKIFSITQDEPKLNFRTSDAKKFNIFIKKNQSKITDKAVKVNFPVLKYYKVFSVDNMTGIKLPKIEAPQNKFDNIEVAEAIIKNMPNPPKLILESKGDKAFHRQATDSVTMPKKSYFDNEQFYYSVLFHELIHSTGNPKRLDRVLGSEFGSPAYSFEELIAEFGALFLCAEAGILYKTIDNSASYIKGWKAGIIKNAKEDNKFIFRAVSKSQAAADYILARNEKGEPKYLKNHGTSKEKKDINKNNLKKPKQLELFGLNGSKNIDSSIFKNMTVTELRAFTLNYYKKFLTGKSIDIENHISEIEFTNKNGRKLAKGGAMYSSKAAIIDKLDGLIRRSTYNNWGERKKTDHPEIIGFLNFKSKLMIDGEKRHIRISIEIWRGGKKILKNYDIGAKKKSSDSKGFSPLDEETELHKKSTKVNSNNKSEGLKGEIKETVLFVPITPLQSPIAEIPVTFDVLSPGLANVDVAEKQEVEKVFNVEVEKQAPVVISKKHTDKKNVLSTADIMNKNFDTIPFSGEWADFMQEPAKTMKLAIWGKPKNGKTAGATALANYLTNFGSILYNFADQGVNKSTQDLWKLSGLSEKDNAYLTETREIKELDKLCASGDYDFVFIDMINTYIHRTGIKYFEFEEQFMKKYPNISFILIFEVTKSGNFKGDQGWTHLPDALITVDSFVMHNQGRYGVGEYVVWKEGLKKVNAKKYKEMFGDESKVPEEIILSV